MPRDMMNYPILGWRVEYMESRKSLLEIFQLICQKEIVEAFVVESPLAPGVTTIIAFIKLVHGCTREDAPEFFHIESENLVCQPARSWKCCRPYIEVGGRFFTYGFSINKAANKKKKREENNFGEEEFITLEKKNKLNKYR